jgi:hypothetical protein
MALSNARNLQTLSKLPPIGIISLFVFVTASPVVLVKWLFTQSRKKVVIIPQSLPEEGVIIPLFSALLLGPFGNSRFFMRPSSPLLPKLLLLERGFKVSSFIKFTGTKRISYQEIESAEISWKDLVPIGCRWIAIQFHLTDRNSSYSIWMNEENAKGVVDFLLRKSVLVTEDNRPTGGDDIKKRR